MDWSEGEEVNEELVPLEVKDEEPEFSPLNTPPPVKAPTVTDTKQLTPKQLKTEEEYQHLIQIAATKNYKEIEDLNILRLGGKCGIV